MKKYLLLLVVVFQVACSSATTTSSRPAPTSCDSSTQRIGTYLTHYVAVSGDCGDIADSLVVLAPPNPDGGAPSGCTLTSQSVSANGCKIDRDETCPGTPDGTVETVITSTQDTADGSEIHGVATFNIRTSRSSCFGTYDLTLTRQ